MKAFFLAMLVCVSQALAQTDSAPDHGKALDEARKKQGPCVFAFDEDDNDPKTIFEHACCDHASAKKYDKMIDQEKALTKESGVTNKTNRYEFARAKLSAQESLASAQKEYKKKTGKNMNFANCPK